jgi:membrane-bound serine protease (ClpP class)
MPLILLLLACLLSLPNLAAAEAGASASASAVAATAAEARPAATPVAYLPIDGPIDSGRARFFKRALAEAKTKGARTVVVHLTTDGGKLESGREMLLEALNVGADGPRLVAFVDNRAYSAGSLIAYGHHEILLTPQATIGDIGVIMMKQDGTIEYAPEKIETVVRTLLRSAGQNRGWNTAKLAKMVAREQVLWQIDRDGTREWVIGDDLPAFLARHQELRRDGDFIVSGPATAAEAKTAESRRYGHAVLGEDRLLSYTAQGAVDDGMATALVADLDAVYARLGTSKDAVISLAPSTTESVSWTLAEFAPLLAALAVIFLILEFKTPGVGIWATLAVVCGAAFFVCQFYMELASYVEVVLVVLGVGLVLAELFLLPTGGWLAIAGGLLMAAGFVLAFMPDISQFDPKTPEWGGNFAGALFRSLLALTAITVAAVLTIIALPRMALRTGLATATAIDGTSAAPLEHDLAALAGQRGTASSDLTPSGRVAVGGREVGAASEHGEFIRAGAAVVVVGVHFGELVVRPAGEG